MNHLELKIEIGWLWIEDRSSRFEDVIIPHQHLIHLFLFIHCRESRFFEDIVKLWIFCYSLVLILVLSLVPSLGGSQEKQCSQIYIFPVNRFYGNRNDFFQGKNYSFIIMKFLNIKPWLYDTTIFGNRKYFCHRFFFSNKINSIKKNTFKKIISKTK